MHVVEIQAYILGAAFVLLYWCSSLRLIHVLVMVKRGKLQVLPDGRRGVFLHLLGAGLSFALPLYFEFGSRDGNVLAFGMLLTLPLMLVLFGIAEVLIKTKRP
jgi:hypothetical protein